MVMSERSFEAKDAALRAIEQAVLGYYRGDLVQRELMAEIVMTLEEAGYISANEDVRHSEQISA